MKKVGLATKIIHGTGHIPWDFKRSCLHISIFFYFIQLVGLAVITVLLITLLFFSAAYVMSHYQQTRQRHGEIRKEPDRRITIINEASMTAS